MTLTTISKEEFTSFANTVSHRSFIQSAEMADLLEKRGNTVQFIAWKQEDQVQVAAILYSLPMTGGLHMEINSGPLYQEEAMLEPFYAALKDYAKENGAIELVIKPYDTYQTFDSDGNPTSEEQTHFMDTLKILGYQHDGLTTGYPGGEGDWHYVKDMEGITEKNLLKSFSKKGKPLVKKAKSFGIELKRLNRDELQLFKDITSSTSDRRDYQDKTLDYYQTFYDSFGDNADFMIATLNFHHYYTNLEKDQGKLAQKIEKLQKDLEVNPNSEKKQNQLRKIAKRYIDNNNGTEEKKVFPEVKKTVSYIPKVLGKQFLSLPVEIFKDTLKWDIALYALRVRNTPEEEKTLNDLKKIYEKLIEEKVEFRAAYGYFRSKKTETFLEMEGMTFEVSPNLAQYIEKEDYVGGFVISVGSKIFKDDKYLGLLETLLCNAIAETASEYMETRVSEDIVPTFLRPAVGYPILPDHSLKKVVFDLIDGERTGAKLSPAFAMTPLSTVCGFYLCNDNAKY